MNVIDEYKIVSAPTLEQLIDQVNDAMENGWIPTGGLTVFHVQNRVIQQGNDLMAQIQQYFGQAMVLGDQQLTPDQT